MDKEQIKEEYKKCVDSPYYFCTKYLVIDGKPFTTSLNEKEFNEFYNFSKKDFALKNRQGRLIWLHAYE